MMTWNGRGTADVRARLVGLHKATKRLSGGRVAIYAYAFRGGDLIARAEGGSLDAANRAMELELGRPATLDKIDKARRQVRQSESRAYIRGLISAFKASPEWAKLGKSSKVAYAYYLADFDAEFGDWKVSIFERAETKIDLIDWRDEWAETPRAADYALQSVGRLFKWARGRGLSNARPTDDVERLHSADRSDIIWTQADIDAVLRASSQEVGWSFRLAAETGLRLGDIVRLPWSAIGAEGTVWKTSKRGRQALIPHTPAMRALIQEVPRLGPVFLSNTRGKPWTVDGLKSMVRAAKREAGIKGLHFHDFRGTAVTRTYLVLPDPDALARIFGWDRQSVDALLAKYVSGDAVALDLLSRMNQKRAAQTDDKPVLRSDS
ncbi:tyrosine-type recombinase/integrase [Brevundimonas mediterranea]|uniref:Tyr recombinase domain-containing protein n=1 Tax=Brevundimonas mediterranea TaxID=74329 RepID=A0A7Z8Y2Y9_9CAUL|nr:tyrosine-type recombinase/integrase [Brevundimonas mediterranea]VDC49735.1 hypothetical protein BREV_BREV_01381 [Brevundimonas mediterranea]